MVRGALGKIYGNGEVIIRQGSTGESMYVIQGGRVEVLQNSDSGAEQHLAYLERGDFFGEMALVLDQPRAANVEAATELELFEMEFHLTNPPPSTSTKG